MVEGGWYYIKDNTQHGPITKTQLQDLLDSGALVIDILVWSYPMKGWLPANKTGQFMTISPDSPPPIPQPPPLVQSQEKPIMTTIPAKPKVRPWVRYWARLIDYGVFSICFGIFIGFFFAFFPTINNLFARMNAVLFSVIVILVWNFFEAILLSTTGSTLGKWLMSTQVRDAYGNKLTFSKALPRSFYVWGLGMGLGLPIVTFVLNIVAYSNLKKSGSTQWDRDLNLIVSHKKIGPIKIIIAIFIIIGFFTLNIIGMSQNNS